MIVSYERMYYFSDFELLKGIKKYEKIILQIIIKPMFYIVFIKCKINLSS